MMNHKFEVGSTYRKNRIYFDLTVSRRTDKTVWFYVKAKDETYMKRIKRDIDGNEYVCFDDKNYPYIYTPGTINLWAFDVEENRQKI